MRYRPRMAARTPRRSFATPFVVTLAAAPACYVQPASPPPAAPATVVANPPRPQEQPVEQVVANPPRPAPPAAGMTWHVVQTADGCEASVDTHCPTGMMCNPPPPQKYACPAGIVMSRPITIVSEGQGICHVQPEPVSCPAGAVCNPPRPAAVTCPR
jgi:hypothetical protein